MTLPAATHPEVSVTLRMRADVAPSRPVSGRIESAYGEHDFCGWLDLLGQLEGLVELAQTEPGRRGGAHPWRR